MSAPVVGVTTAVEQAKWGVWDQPAAVLPLSYADAIQDAGGLALLLPPDPALTADPAPLLDRLDGLVLSGGSDLDPATYGAEPHPETKVSSSERDAFELALARAAIDRDLPLLAVCRGMHVLNVALGGTLEQHLPDELGHDRHRHSPGSFSDHDVRLAPGSRAAALAGGERLAVRSHHHQGLGRLGDGLSVSGVSADADEIVEAVELPDRSFVVGILWHPEEDAPSGVIARFVREAIAGSLGGSVNGPTEAIR